MGIFSAIGNFFSGAVSLVSNAISSIGSSLANFATSFLIKLPFPNINIVIKAIIFIAKMLGVTEEGEKIEEIGAKALESDKKPEDFDSTQQYIEHLRNDIKLDTEKFNKSTDAEKLAYNAIGVSIVSKGISEKMELKEDIPVDFWVEAGLQKLSSIETKSFLERFTSNDMNLDFGEYLKGNLSITENKKYFSVISETLKELNPEMNNNEIEDKVFEMKQISRDNK